MAKRLASDFFYNKHTLDGAFGTRAIELGGLGGGEASETLSLSRPDIVKKVHALYAAAGADVICANTFGANPLKHGDYPRQIRAALTLARTAAPECVIALDVGPSGLLLGEGGVDFDDAVQAYLNYYSACDDYDFILIETMADLKELRAALLAAKEIDKPVACSMSFESNGRTFFGCDLESFAVTAAALGANALGINCSLGAVKLKPLAKRLAEISPLPVFIKPNAGMPSLVNGATVYDEDVDTFAAAMEEIASYGIAMLGGCCGTDERYIERLAKIERKCSVGGSAAGKLCCALKSVSTGGQTLTVGERINPTGKPRLKRALTDGDVDYVVTLALEQAEQGAHLLDVNVGLNGIDEAAVMKRAVRALSGVGLPLVLDSSSPAVLEAALKEYDGKALINSVNAKEESLSAVLPLAKKYGAAVIGLCLDERGIPETADGRVEAALKIIDRAEKEGIERADIYIDALTLAEGSGRGNALAAIETLKRVKETGVKTVLGISNISFGMPDREDINAAFLQMSKDAGLDLAIISPKLASLTGSKAAYDFLSGKEGAAERYIAAKTALIGLEEKDKFEAGEEAAPDLKTAIIRGLTGAAEAAAKQKIKEMPPLQVAENFIIPALDEVGERYEKGVFFLPQLLSSADAAKAAMEVLSAALPEGEADKGKRFVLCTVRGDVHDIGKNIVKAVAANYGFRVIDLGRDVSEQAVLQAVRAHYPCVLGLSALMTTTAENMALTIKTVRGEFPDLEILVGGAVLTEEYASKIGGVYCRDAADTVKRLKECKFGQR